MTIELRPATVDGLRRLGAWHAVLGAVLLSVGTAVPDTATAAEAPGAVPVAGAPSAGASVSEPTYSEAENLLWMTDQLKSVSAPMKLTYRFEKSGTYEEGFTDTVEFIIDTIREDGLKSASLNFFTGERNVPVPPVPGTDVNPIIKVYLQGDVYEMNRLTDSQGASKERWRYFQRRIKFALTGGATITPTTVEFNGRQYPAQQVSFAPYVNDPHRNEFERFADKRYTVIVADELPGYLYSIETVVPGQGEGVPPLIRESLRLEKLEPAAMRR